MEIAQKILICGGEKASQIPLPMKHGTAKNITVRKIYRSHGCHDIIYA